MVLCWTFYGGHFKIITCSQLFWILPLPEITEMIPVTKIPNQILWDWNWRKIVINNKLTQTMYLNTLNNTTTAILNNSFDLFSHQNLASCTDVMILFWKLPITDCDTYKVCSLLNATPVSGSCSYTCHCTGAATCDVYLISVRDPSTTSPWRLCKIELEGKWL